VKKNSVRLWQKNAQADLFLPSKPMGCCVFDAKCDDRKYCTSVEKCAQNVCVKGTHLCMASDSDWIVSCNEIARNCIRRPKINCGLGTGKICP
jgi:hypothetical protein